MAAARSLFTVSFRTAEGWQHGGVFQTLRAARKMRDTLSAARFVDEAVVWAGQPGGERVI